MDDIGLEGRNVGQVLEILGNTLEHRIVDLLTYADQSKSGLGVHHVMAMTAVHLGIDCIPCETGHPVLATKASRQEILSTIGPKPPKQLQDTSQEVGQKGAV